MFTGASGNSSLVKKSRTFSGALYSENQEVPGSESSSASESEWFEGSSAFGVEAG